MTKQLLAIAIAAWGSCALMGQAAMPAAQQNGLVAKYCAVCHTDAARNGGLTLEHFDAAHADPGVAAMLFSKLANGLPLARIEAARHDPSVSTLIATKMKGGAMGAAGVPIPDRATQDALVLALSAEAAGADRWFTNQTQRPAPVFTASVIRETPSPVNAGDADMYRLTLTCRADTGQGEMQLSWSPGVPRSGQAMSIAADGNAPVTYKVEGSETMGNGTGVTSGPGAALLPATQKDSLPLQTLTVKDLFPGQTVVFPFDELSPAARQPLAACFHRATPGE